MAKTARSPVVSFSSRAEWAAWLEDQHATSSGVWLKVAKKQSGIASVSYPEAVEVALCHGWIDGQKDTVDDDYWLQRFTPRTARSKWSKLNCERVEELIRTKQMQPSGLRRVAEAKADGRWAAAYESPSRATVPDDLRSELTKNPRAKQFFDQLDSANRYAILHRIQDATKPETRVRRIEKYVAMLSEGKKIHP
jgi:uncharacterized protein YdeI (YjbR/CyaY-like superfamily)